MDFRVLRYEVLLQHPTVRTFTFRDTDTGLILIA